LDVENVGDVEGVENVEDVEGLSVVEDVENLTTISKLSSLDGTDWFLKAQIRLVFFKRCRCFTGFIIKIAAKKTHRMHSMCL
jgi:hypothetical protein